jgi:hypothetical protein
MIALLGLHELEKSGRRSPIEVKQVLLSLLKRTDWISNIGDLGLLLWLTSLVFPDRIGDVCSSLNLELALERYPDAREGKTTELAWFLAGLAHVVLSGSPDVPDLTDEAVKAYKGLEANQGGTGIFGHLTRRGSLAGLLRWHIGSFADQVYPIYALSKLSQAYDIEEAHERALDCADAICRLQGPLGQWWWHYDSTSGQVVRKYPVFAVHQDGMAPLALFAASEVTGRDFSEPVQKGLVWIAGKNELGKDLRDTSIQAIWRSIRPLEEYRMYLDDVRGVLRLPTNDGPLSNLGVLEECRPYHLGWLLYAYAQRGANELNSIK